MIFKANNRWAVICTLVVTILAPFNDGGQFEPKNLERRRLRELKAAEKKFGLSSPTTTSTITVETQRPNSKFMAVLPEIPSPAVAPVLPLDVRTTSPVPPAAVPTLIEKNEKVAEKSGRFKDQDQDRLSAPPLSSPRFRASFYDNRPPVTPNQNQPPPHPVIRISFGDSQTPPLQNVKSWFESKSGVASTPWPIIPILKFDQEIQEGVVNKVKFLTANGIEQEEETLVLPKGQDSEIVKTGQFLDGPPTHSPYDDDEDPEDCQNDQVEIVKKGSYSYTGADGRLVQVNWIADKNGFRPTESSTGANLQKKLPQVTDGTIPTSIPASTVGEPNSLIRNQIKQEPQKDKVQTKNGRFSVWNPNIFGSKV